MKMAAIPTRARIDLTSPRTIATYEFATARRGFDRDEVRALLDQVAAEMQRLRDENGRLEGELTALAASPVRTPELDEATVAGLLGEEAGRLLSTAKEAANQIRSRAEDAAEQIRRDAEVDADLRRQEAAAEAGAEIEAAKAEGRHMVHEARAVRERMLGDLARRRDMARGQLQRLRTDRDRILASFEDAARSVQD